MSLAHDAKITIVIDAPRKPRPSRETKRVRFDAAAEYEPLEQTGRAAKTSNVGARVRPVLDRAERAWMAQIDAEVVEYLVDRGRFPCETISAGYCQHVMLHLLSPSGGGYGWEDVLRRLAVYQDLWVEFMEQLCSPAARLAYLEATGYRAGHHHGCEGEARVPRIGTLTTETLELWLHSTPGTAHLGMPIKWWITSIAPKADCWHACMRQAAVCAIL